MVTPTQRFNRELAANQLLLPTKTIVVAVSTGVDSMVLLTLLQQLPLKQRPHLVVAHVNHHLRAQSAREANFLIRYCHDHQLSLEVADWPVADHPQTGVEAAGRQFRYDFFARVMRAVDAAALLTAHHANDQAETFLMKVARGGDLAQLTGIAASRPFVTGRLVRPLLSWPKQTLRDYAEQQRVPFFEDVTNQDVHLTRNRIRHRVVPELTTINPELLGHIASYEKQLTELLAAKADMVATLLPAVVTSTDALVIAKLRQVPASWQLAVLRAWLERRCQQRFSELKLRPILHWILKAEPSNQPVPLNSASGLVKKVDIIDVCPLKKRVKKLMPAQKIMVDLNQWQKITAIQTAGVFTRTPPANAQPLRLTATDGLLSWRPWRTGDQLTLKGGGHQSVRRILIDQKVPVAQRSQVMVLVNAQQTVLWVVGHKFIYRDRDTGTQTVFLALKHRS